MRVLEKKNNIKFYYVFWYCKSKVSDEKDVIN